jgi:hypothetical protein
MFLEKGKELLPDGFPWSRNSNVAGESALRRCQFGICLQRFSGASGAYFGIRTLKVDNLLHLLI